MDVRITQAYTAWYRQRGVFTWGRFAWLVLTGHAWPKYSFSRQLAERRLSSLVRRTCQQLVHLLRYGCGKSGQLRRISFLGTFWLSIVSHFCEGRWTHAAPHHGISIQFSTCGCSDLTIPPATAIDPFARPRA